MNTSITLTYKGEVYTLEYDRSTIKILENAGFKLDEFLDKPMTNIEMVFDGAFLKHHRKLPEVIKNDIFKHVKDKTGLLQILQQMITESYESLLEDPPEDSDDEGNVTWEVVDLSPKKTEKK